MIETIVVAHDGSDGSVRALDWAIGLARQTDARLVVVHAWSPLEELGKRKPPCDPKDLHDEALARLRDEWCRPAIEAGTPYEARLIEDLPVPGLVRAARDAEADLLVCGTRGIGGVKGMVLGSVARELPAKAHRPVTVVPDGAGDRGSR
jgi:nucleotide-binding universal stress UspA family protein